MMVAMATDELLWTEEEVEELKFFVFPGGYSAYETRGDCYFDVKAARRAVNFGILYIRHVKAAKGGEPFIPELWQAALLAAIFGWKMPDGRRRYRIAYIEIPRGNGKSFP